MTNPAWAYTDLRAIDRADATDPALDLIAGYARQVGPDLQIRLDLLDLTLENNIDLYLGLGAQDQSVADALHPTDFLGSVLLHLPAQGPITVLSGNPTQRVPVQSAAVRVIRNPQQDSIDIYIRRAALHALPIGLSVQAWAVDPETHQVSDHISPFDFEGSPPQPASVFLAFWDTYPVYSPATALRRWDGAHTGPKGARHGLGNLLRAARAFDVPLALLDGKQPSSLSALDFSGGLALIQELSSQGLLILPETGPALPYPQPGSTLPATFVTQVSQENRLITLRFNLPASPFTFVPAGAPLPEPPGSYLILQQPLNNSSSSYELTGWERQGDRQVLPLPDYPAGALQNQQAGPDGPTIDLRRALVDAARSATDPNRKSAILPLGGSLPASSWGDPQMARITFAYLARHPWIRILNQHHLQTLPTVASFRQPVSQTLVSGGQVPDAIQRLEATPYTQFSVPVREYLRGLMAPVSPAPDGLISLRQQYTGLANLLEEAAAWAAEPESEAECREHGPEQISVCVLASEQVFAMVDPQGGYLMLLFIRTPDGVTHQVIAPSSQLISGISTPDSWDLDAGLFSDPVVLPGALIDRVPEAGMALEVGELVQYSVQVSPEALILMSSGGIQKTFLLIPDGIQVSYHYPEGEEWSRVGKIQIPLNLDPWNRFYPGWGDRFQGETISDGWRWSLAPPPDLNQERWGVEILTNSQLAAFAFSDTRDLLQLTEDPDREYSPGHFLPFPLALAEVTPMAGLKITIQQRGN